MNDGFDPEGECECEGGSVRGDIDCTLAVDDVDQAWRTGAPFVAAVSTRNTGGGCRPGGQFPGAVSTM